MSITLQRIYFSGTFMVDPSTANNNHVAYLFDAALVELTPYWRDKSDDWLINWMETPGDVVNPYSGESQQLLPSYWDYYGTNNIWFESVKVTGAHVIENGERRYIGDDPLVGTSIFLLGDQGTSAKMVDLDPTNEVSTQIFNNQLLFGNEDGFCRALSPTRGHLRWIFAPRNLDPPNPAASASAIFRSAIHPDGLNIVNSTDSAILQAVADAKAAECGLSLLYCLYFTTEPELNAHQLAAEFAKGNKIRNPAQGRIVGSLGLWKPGELASVPPGRVLLPPLTFNPSRPNDALLGPATAEIDLDRKVVTLNLITSIPETGSYLNKADLGDLTLEVKNPDQTVHEVGKIKYVDYGREAYERFAGVAEVSFAGKDERIASYLVEGSLQIRAEHKEIAFRGFKYNFQEIPLVETEYEISTDDRAIYLNLGETDGTQSSEVELRLSHRGRPVSNKAIEIGQWRSSVTATGVPSVDGQGEASHGTMPNQGFTGLPVNLVSNLVTTNEQGSATFSVDAASAGTAILYFWVVDEQPEPSGPSLLTLLNISYISVRVLPDDSYLDSAPVDDWDVVFRNVLRYYHILYPGMSQHIPLNSSDAVIAYAPEIIMRTDPNQTSFDSTRFMPVTREMSAGKRRYLLRALRHLAPNVDQAVVEIQPMGFDFGKLWGIH